jgi:hypothetical protein
MDSSQPQRGAFDIDTCSEDAVRKDADVHSLEFACRVSEVLAPSALSVLIVVAAAA